MTYARIQIEMDDFGQSRHVYDLFKNALRPYLDGELNLTKSFSKLIADGRISEGKNQDITRKLVSILGDEWGTGLHT